MGSTTYQASCTRGVICVLPSPRFASRRRFVTPRTGSFFLGTKTRATVRPRLGSCLATESYMSVSKLISILSTSAYPTILWYSWTEAKMSLAASAVLVVSRDHRYTAIPFASHLRCLASSFWFSHFDVRTSPFSYKCERLLVPT